VVVFTQAARRAVRSGIVWGYIFGIIVASSAISYTTIYSTQADRTALATAFGSNNATAALFGPGTDLQTVGGFTVFKSYMTVMVLGALWGLLTSTRLLRGEEDAGRWDLVLTGQVTQRGATVQVFGGLGAGVAALWLVAAVITVLAGLDSKVGFSVGSSLYFALSQVTTAVMFLAVGALTSQLAPTRRQAATLGGWFLGASYVVRMVADAGVGVHGLIWLTPLGWAEELRPLTSPNPVALLPIFAFTAIVGGVAVDLSSRRDVGSGVLPDRPHAVAKLRFLTGHLGLSARLVRPTLTAWIAALGATGFVLGLIAKQAGGTISGSSVQEVFARLGATGSGAQEFLGVSFLIVAVMVGFMAAGQVTALRTEEAEGRFDNLVVQPVSRSSWLGGRLLIVVVALVAASVVTGFLAWTGTAVEGGGVSLGTLLEAGINVVPPALCLLGLGVLAFGVVPRAVSYVVYTILGWSLVVEVVGGFGSGGRWLLDTSLFHQMAAAPAVHPNWTVNGVMTGLGGVAALVGCLLFSRRDLRGA
jgi:ABC-2 type transport system permease protein